MVLRCITVYKFNLRLREKGLQNLEKVLNLKIFIYIRVWGLRHGIIVSWTLYLVKDIIFQKGRTLRMQQYLLGKEVQNHYIQKLWKDS